MINPKFYLARRNTRWDVYPSEQPVKAVAHDWHGFWERTVNGEWFKTPTSYDYVREITEDEANAFVEPATVAGLQHNSPPRAGRKITTMTKSDLNTQLAALPADAIVVSRSYTWTRHTTGGGCTRGTVEQVRRGAGEPAEAPARDPDLHTNHVSLDGDSGETRDVWIGSIGREVSP